MMVRILCLVFTFVLFVPSSTAQEILVTRLPIQRELPIAHMHHVIQDNEGFMWYATEGGLCRSNGYQVDVFKNDLSHPNFWSSNSVGSLAVGKDDKIWVVTGNGLYYVDKTDYSLHEVKVKELEGQYISELTVTDDGCVWVIGGHYVVKLSQDGKLLKLYKANLKKYVNNLFGIELDDLYFETHIGSGLLYNVNQDNMDYIPIESVFSKDIIKDGFDIIVTNPPYKNLKAERSQYLTDDEYDVDRRKYFDIAKNAKKQFSLSLSGTLNLYRLFVEEILTKYSNRNSYCSLLIPSSILSDKSCSDLRSFMIKNSAIKNIRLFSETSAYVDASQSVCSILLEKGSKTTKLEIHGLNDGAAQYDSMVNIADVADEKTGNSILILNKREYAIRRQMTKHPAIKDIPYIMNLRGELDITLNKQYITSHETPFKLLRGRNISYYKTVNLESAEYVLQDFYEQSAKKVYIEKPRLICQQIVNMAKARRVSFAPVPKDVILANSCNFISLLENEDGVDLYFLLGVLNSSIIDWFFKLTSSNNHINNYEIDNFPIPIGADNKEEISRLVKEYLKTENEELIP